ncbi:hypothetical protein D3C83_303820 [compost metagenome]
MDAIGPAVTGIAPFRLRVRFGLAFEIRRGNIIEQDVKGRPEELAVDLLEVAEERVLVRQQFV